VQLDRHTHPGLEPSSAKDQPGTIRIGLGARVPDRDGHPLGERRPARAHPQPFLLLLHQLGLLVGCAGPTKLSIGVSEHEAGSVGAEQGRGGHHDLLQGGGQAALEIQVMEFADARGQGGLTP
jgi:hypothetical protein